MSEARRADGMHAPTVHFLLRVERRNVRREIAAIRSELTEQRRSDQSEPLPQLPVVSGDRSVSSGFCGREQVCPVGFRAYSQMDTPDVPTSCVSDVETAAPLSSVLYVQASVTLDAGEAGPVVERPRRHQAPQEMEGWSAVLDSGSPSIDEVEQNSGMLVVDDGDLQSTAWVQDSRPKFPAASIVETHFIVHTHSAKVVQGAWRRCRARRTFALRNIDGAEFFSTVESRRVFVEHFVLPAQRVLARSYVGCDRLLGNDAEDCAAVLGRLLGATSLRMGTLPEENAHVPVGGQEFTLRSDLEEAAYAAVRRTCLNRGLEPLNSRALNRGFAAAWLNMLHASRGVGPGF